MLQTKGCWSLNHRILSLQLLLQQPFHSFSSAIRNKHQNFKQQRSSGSSSGSNNNNVTIDDDDDAFSIFGIPHRFAIDEQALKETYRQLMEEHHPDKQQHNGNDNQHRFQKASSITRAYDRLRRKHTRATHLMELLGKPMEESSSGMLVGQEFLMQIMELRQAVEDAAAVNDHADREALLRPLWEENKRRIQETCERLDQVIESGDLETALELTARLQYWNRMDETIRVGLESL